MSPPLATYSFLPWLRQGLSNAITESETAANAALRASIAVQVTLRAEGLPAPVPDQVVDRTVRLYGPGDVLGIDRQAIIKTEPRDWITNYEPNNLAHIEFYDEDFPWRYSPARPDAAAHRHRPWIALAVLAEDEFTDGDAKGKPLPFIDIPDLGKLPVKEELWAWAHVHVNRNLGADETVIVNNDGPAIAARLETVLSENPDLAYSRIVGPRRLSANTAYHAFLVPTFETGRVAGLGLDVTKVDDAMRGAWEAHPERVHLSGSSMPYYHRWYFRTGNGGDFEFLVRLLKPQPLDARVGRRDIDVQRPGSNLDGIAGPNGDGVLRLGGALKVPVEALTEEAAAEAERFEKWDDPRPHDFQRDLAAFVNLADEYATKSAKEAHEGGDVPEAIGVLPDGDTDPDPLITPPLYGRWHALVQRLLTERDGSPSSNHDNWVHTLNLDPRHRVAAGLGTKVIRDRQEDYVNAAWEQVGAVLEANRKLRLAQFGKAVSQAWFTKHLSGPGSSPAAVLSLTAALARRVVVGGFTLRKQVADSRVPPATTGTAMRRVLRPGGRLARALARRDPSEARESIGARLIERLNAGTLTSAQAPAVPGGAATVLDLSRSLLPAGPAWWIDVLRRQPRAPLFVLIGGLLLAALLLVSGPSVLAAAAVAAAAGAGSAGLNRQVRAIEAADSLLPDNETVAVVDALPADASFAVTPFGAPFTSAPGAAADSEEAARFKQALRAQVQLAREAAEVTKPVVRVPLDLAATATATLAAIDPARTIPLRFHKTVLVPDRIKDGLRGDFVEAMVYPRIDDPMYRPLAELGSELFLPNVGLIPPNSISLLETNQAFIESYMVGLNHEFARELLWREYPTDQRGSYFRQFWDVSGYTESGGLSVEQLREKLYDVPKLHRWLKTSALGQHDHRQPPGSPPKDEVVLAIRGELLKRYPTAVIYAHRADWQRTSGVIDKSLIRTPVELSAAEEANPPRDKVKTPLYEAKVEPDITFFGFDLTVPEARGNPEADDAGWFFIIKERPGEPRFGLDIERGGAPINTWSDLAWDDVTTENGLLRIRPGMQTHELTVPPVATEGPEEMEQHLEDRQLAWNPNTNAADVAYVLYQLPVLVAVHAAEMLPKS